MELKEAIASLDPRNDDHWTEQGLPRMEVIKELTGSHFSRKEITEAAPLVTRERLLAGESTAVNQDPDADKTDDPEVKTTQEEAAPEAPVDDVVARLEGLVTSTTQALHDAEQAANAANAEVKRLRSLLDKHQTDLDNARPRENPQLHIMQYLKTQQKMREERASRMAPSALDQTLMTRRRPVRTPL